MLDHLSQVVPTAETRRPWFLLLAVSPLLLITSAGCTHESSPSPAPDATEVREMQTGLASYYHPSLDGEETAGGTTFDNDALTAAHPTYPLGTLVRVTSLEKEASVEVRITDRGPTAENRAEGVIIDLSGAAAEKIGMLKDGRTRVRVDVVEWGRDERK